MLIVTSGDEDTEDDERDAAAAAAAADEDDSKGDEDVSNKISSGDMTAVICLIDCVTCLRIICGCWCC